jgi:aspartyl-tRNA(Asn)/glutamyl-tRNA(Gln) amidotransferase subunit B
MTGQPPFGTGGPADEGADAHGASGERPLRGDLPERERLLDEGAPAEADLSGADASGPSFPAGWEPVIGLEVHVQLRTETKIFCGCSTAFGAPPNTQVCPICLGFPGSLPVLNARAVEYAVKSALALNCTVHPRSVFARKNYFYPDLPKGYQISQFDRPLATDGWLELGVPDAADGDGRGPGASAGNGGGRAAPEGPASGDARRIRITRLHLEEDAGKSFHGAGESGGTLLDFNRCGVPLIEIVSGPDIRSPEEAYRYLVRLKQILRYLGVSDVNMEEGSLRCDANVSVRRAGRSELGTKTEVKNLNSFRNVERALAYEIRRQAAALEAGGAVEHQTLLWDAARAEARPMRSKELSHDYRYFPEPDLGPLALDPLEVDEWRRALPELPAAREERLAAQYGIPAYDAAVLSSTSTLADWFETAAAAYGGPPKEVSNWVMGEVLRVLKERGIEADALPVRPEQLGELLKLKDAGTVSGRTAKGIFEKMLASGKGPQAILEEENLAQISDEAEIRSVAEAVLDERPSEVAGFLGGRQQLLSFFIGELMKKTRGRANPQAAARIFRELLETRRTSGSVEPPAAGEEPEPPLETAAAEGAFTHREEPPAPAEGASTPREEPPAPAEGASAPAEAPAGRPVETAAVEEASPVAGADAPAPTPGADDAGPPAGTFPSRAQPETEDRDGAPRAPEGSAGASGGSLPTKPESNEPSPAQDPGRRPDEERP